MRRLQQIIDKINISLYNPVGLNILWPRNVAFMFVSNWLFYEPVKTTNIQCSSSWKSNITYAPLSHATRWHAIDNNISSDLSR
jgi:hypothetical protein